MGREALEDIVYRAQLELYSQPLLVSQRTALVVCVKRTLLTQLLKFISR